MPELAELRLTADYINHAAKDKVFSSIIKNPDHKWNPKTKVGYRPDKNFKLSAKSRGKELIVYLNDFPMRMSMGMTGYFRLTYTGEEYKHSHIIFESTCGKSLSFIDVRRFGKWWPGQEWSDNRSPDPTTEFSLFKKNIKDNLEKKAFNKPIGEILLNQSYFNGIGNYLRAEIIYRIPELSPFTEARAAIKNFPKILDLCKSIPELAYVKGGGSIKDWNNPFGNESDSFMKCYGNPNMAKEKDGTGRMMWYRPEHQWKEIGDAEWDHYSGLPSPAFYKK